LPEKKTQVVSFNAITNFLARLLDSLNRPYVSFGLELKGRKTERRRGWRWKRRSDV